MKTKKEYGVKLSAKGRLNKLAQNIFGEGKTVFVMAFTKKGAKVKALNNLKIKILNLELLKAEL